MAAQQKLVFVCVNSYINSDHRFHGVTQIQSYYKMSKSGSKFNKNENESVS